ncbi:serine hydrolase [Longimicrobium terrae]|uniref:beta-lactamase n=1 Tax=Longimicrobium terrae TaxID=1639882 RepID=A0A841H5R9_9BACT|nr:serine hydrolase [Longimicrobium terrae]MBB4639117.1 beta-lactamase class A [Longimicrobium terrae]MBB6073282.1 beta-lactamase class A [Longimicrobium terrae]NNC28723.1 serine hydrolase [Longimicrobium terrae]
MASRKERKEDDDPLRTTVSRIADEAGARSVAVAYHDYETRTAWSFRGDEWFHAASTIKVPVLLGVFRAVQQGDLNLNARVHVRNRFLSVADGSSFRLQAGRDANSEVQSAIGRTMKVDELAFHMITTSSNLATNLLIEIVGVDRIRETLKDLNLDDGVEFRRGVEDERAYEAGISNRCTADGMLRVLRAIEERKSFSAQASERMLEILHAQVFRSGIPAGLPDDARVAHKTGEISTVAHDVGIVYLPKRKPFALVVLTEWDAQKTSGRSDTIARITAAVYERLTGKGGA